MKTSHSNAAGRVGYVRAVFSQRAKGFAAPVDLLRVVAKVAGRVARRERIADAFKGYLVSESGQVKAMFAPGRDRYQWPVIRNFCVSPVGGGFGLHVSYGRAWGFPIDAPEFMAVGSVIADGEGVYPSSFERGSA